ncbi:MAG: polysaccharide biosynthesis protein [Candidatus Sungbacteria bacterium]|nr:polysaccharide biosynthesis protein [Candidatus Sungbacteria bacterium]
MSKLLITGGTGSFGSAALKHFIEDPTVTEITVFSRDEKKQHDLRNHFRSEKIRFIIGDVRERESVTQAVHGVDVIFHAAALKQVPTGEFFPMEMVRTNIFGTENIFRAAEEQGVKKVVLLSTDKAVYPINAMGMSKAMAEKLMASRVNKKSNTVFCAVRYGNVMASRGSVIPLFIEQIKAGRPLTITNPNMTRFMLSLDDSIGLVKTAVSHGEHGDIFIRKSPASVVQDVAKAALNIFSSSAGVNVVGIRAGEKIHEVLMTGLEHARAEDLGEYFRIRNSADGNYDYSRFFDKGEFHSAPEDYTSENTKRLSPKETEDLLRSLDYVKQELETHKGGNHRK